MAGFRALNVKQMYLSLFSCQSQCELEQLFYAFRLMLDHGFISPYAYQRFLVKSSGVEFRVETDHVVDLVCMK